MFDLYIFISKFLFISERLEFIRLIFLGNIYWDLKDLSNEEIPKFSSLASCLLIDASHKSRAEVIKDIKSSSLFEDIVEAKSLNDGLSRIQIRTFDACLVGPSVSLDLVAPFLKKARQTTYAKDCAIISVVRRDSDVSGLSDAHSIVKVPCTKQIFFEGVVRGVLKASANGKWPGFKLSDDGSVMYFDNGEWKELQGESSGNSNEAKIIPENFILTGDSESIKKFCDGLQSSPPSRIEKILKTLLSNSNDVQDPFVKFFVDAILEWKQDQTFLSLKEASQNLRQKLLSFNQEL